MQFPRRRLYKQCKLAPLPITTRLLADGAEAVPANTMANTVLIPSVIISLSWKHQPGSTSNKYLPLKANSNCLSGSYDEENLYLLLLLTIAFTA